MEGASSTVTQLAGGWVRKTQKRKVRLAATRNDVALQERLQRWCAEHLVPAAGYTHLFSPATRPATEPHSIEMREIDVSADPWLLDTLPIPFQAELARFQTAFEAATGYSLYDVEFYPQPDGRVAVVDFDQCRRVVA